MRVGPKRQQKKKLYSMVWFPCPDYRGYGDRTARLIAGVACASLENVKTLELEERDKLLGEVQIALSSPR